MIIPLELPTVVGAFREPLDASIWSSSKFSEPFALSPKAGRRLRRALRSIALYLFSMAFHFEIASAGMVVRTPRSPDKMWCSLLSLREAAGILTRHVLAMSAPH